MTDATKVCPHCAETIKAGAFICPHCQGKQPNRPLPQNMQWILGILILITVATLLYIMFVGR